MGEIFKTLNDISRWFMQNIPENARREMYLVDSSFSLTISFKEFNYLFIYLYVCFWRVGKHGFNFGLYKN